MLDAASDDVTLGDRDDVSDAVSSVDHRSRERALLHLLDTATKTNFITTIITTNATTSYFQCAHLAPARFYNACIFVVVEELRTSPAPSTNENDLTRTCFTREESRSRCITSVHGGKQAIKTSSKQASEQGFQYHIESNVTYRLSAPGCGEREYRLNRDVQTRHPKGLEHDLRGVLPAATNTPSSARYHGVSIEGTVDTFKRRQYHGLATYRARRHVGRGSCSVQLERPRYGCRMHYKHSGIHSTVVALRKRQTETRMLEAL